MWLDVKESEKKGRGPFCRQMKRHRVLFEVSWVGAGGAEVESLRTDMTLFIF